MLTCSAFGSDGGRGGRGGGFARGGGRGGSDAGSGDRGRGACAAAAAAAFVVAVALQAAVSGAGALPTTLCVQVDFKVEVAAGAVVIPSEAVVAATGAVDVGAFNLRGGLLICAAAAFVTIVKRALQIAFACDGFTRLLRPSKPRKIRARGAASHSTKRRWPLQNAAAIKERISRSTRACTDSRRAPQHVGA